MTGYAICGLHRGGTSAVAGVLHHLGVYLGEEENFFPPSEHNPKGYFEDKRIVALHDQMMGGDWKNPDLVFKPVKKGSYEALLAEWQVHPLWAIKDPRLCFTVWLLAHAVKFTTDEPLKLVMVSREPECAAKSLFERGGHTEEEALEISERYYGAWRCVMETYEGARLAIWYDFLVTNPPLAVAEIAKFVGVPVTQEAIDFIDPKLRHHK